MAYTGRGFQRTWTYEPTADDHNARVGKILAGNLDLQSSMRSKALGELGGPDASSSALPAQGYDIPGMNTRVADSRRPSRGSPGGYVWVDPQGRYLGQVASGGAAAAAAASGGDGGVGGGDTGRLLGATAARAAVAAAGGQAGPSTGGGGGGGTGGSGQTLSGRRRAMMTERQAACAALDPPQRSMALWTRINPGSVELTTRTPRSTMKAHFGPKADAPDADSLDKTHHYQKTDFSEYTEVKLRLMQHLKS